MLRNAEYDLYRAIGKFSTIASPYDALQAKVIDPHQPAQCTAFLCSSREFTWFVESWEINRNDDGDVIIENKKIYPVKVTGLNLPSSFFRVEEVRNVSTGDGDISWREGLIGRMYRPGFGQVILSDSSRPLLEQHLPRTDLLGFGYNPAYTSLYRWAFSRQLGRLMSMAFYVDPIAAAKYDASNNTKKKKSLNSQDYEQMPTYPDYDMPTNGY